jgi:hypothetical protein
MHDALEQHRGTMPLPPTWWARPAAAAQTTMPPCSCCASTHCPPATRFIQLRREGLSLPPNLAPRMEFEGFTILREIQ